MADESYVYTDEPEEIDYPSKTPNLLTRYAAALLDLIVQIALIVGFFFLWKLALFTPMGYFKDTTYIRNAYAESSLFVEYNGGYCKVTEDGCYDTTKTSEQNYETPLLYYYTNFDYPLENNKVQTYLIEKEEAGYWNKILDEEYSLPKGSSKETIETWVLTHYERNGTVNESTISGWLSQKYLEAVSFFNSDSSIIRSANHAHYVEYFVIFISEVCAIGIYSFLLPLVLKRGCTPFKLVFKMAIVEKRKGQLAKKSQIFLRYLMLALINIIIPTFWYFFMPSTIGYLALCLPMAEVCVMGINRNGASIHDLVAQTYIADFKQGRLMLKDHLKKDK